MHNKVIVDLVAETEIVRKSSLSHEQQMSMFFENSCLRFVTTDADFAYIESE